MLEAVLNQEVQLGIDIATSATIIGALLYWLIESRRQQKNSRESGINDQTRAALLNKVQGILYEFEDSFSQLVEVSQRFERPVDGRKQERLEQHIKSNPAFIEHSLEKLDNVQQQMDVFYEAIQKRRYSLIPVLDSLPQGDKFMGSLRQDINQIGELHDKLNSGWSGLLQEFHELYKAYYQLVLDNTDTDANESDLVDLLLEKEGFIHAMMSIILDRDYWPWIKTFVPDETEQQFEQMLNDGEQDGKLINPVAYNFAGHFVENPYRLLAEILRLASVEVATARKKCKDILIKLSALTHKLLTNKDNVELDSLIALYESEEYFGRDIFIR